MSFRSLPQSRSTEAPPRRILGVAYQGLKTARARQREQRYNAPFVLRRLNASSASPLEMRLRRECRGLFQLPARLVATHVGDRIFEVRCMLDDGGSCRFSYGLSRRSGRGLSPAPERGRKLAAFLLEELEKRLGQSLLQGTVWSPSSPTSTQNWSRPPKEKRRTTAGRRDCF